MWSSVESSSPSEPKQRVVGDELGAIRKRQEELNAGIERRMEQHEIAQSRQIRALAERMGNQETEQEGIGDFWIRTSR